MTARRRLLASGLTLALGAGLLVASAGTVAAAIITVDSLADDGSGGCTLREAITNANADNQSGSTDCVAGSGPDVVTFSVTGTIFLASTLPTVGAGGLQIQGPGAASLTISGDTNNDGTFTPNVRVLTVGGGASLRLSGVSIASGSDFFGAGVLNQSGGTLTVTGSTFSGNTASFSGGGITNFGNLAVTDSTFSSNRAGSTSGGGILNSGMASVTGSTFLGNSAGLYGGGIYSEGAITVTNSTFWNNSAGDSGGGILNAFDSTATITNSTLSGNSAGVDGGGIKNSLGTTNLKGTIVANNIGGNCFNLPGTINNVGYNIDSGTTCGFGSANGSLSSTDPLLLPPAPNGGPTQTMALQSISPAIDLIPLGSCTDQSTPTPVPLSTDQRGFLRPAGSMCDIGAYEFGAVPPGGGGGGSGPTLTVATVGSGTITSNPPGIACPPDCSEASASAADASAGDAGDTYYVLTATPAPGSVFTAWYGACAGTTTNTCYLFVSSDTFVAAWFDLAGSPSPSPSPSPTPPPTPGTFDLHVSKVGKGRVMSASAEINCGQVCTATYDEGTAVTLTASPRSGWILKRWRYGCSGSELVCTLEMSSNRRAKAVFVRA